MILDNKLQLADAQAFTNAAETTTYSHDMGSESPVPNLGDGEPMALVYVVTTAAAGSTDTTYFRAISSSAAALNAAVKELGRVLVAKAKLVAGAIVAIPIMPGSANMQRYVGGQVHPGSGDTVSADCFLMPLSMVQQDAIYADAITIS